MISLVTGASSGIGRDIAIEFAKRRYDLIIVARSLDRLNELKFYIEEKYKVKVYVKVADLSKKEEVLKLYEEVKEEHKNIDVLVNNAGFGECGFFDETDLEKDISMIETNIIALHILTKKFVKDMIARDKGYILNVASVASFMPGPLMATYYATKGYVLRLSKAINVELKKKKSKVKISVLCPGPVDTNFNKNANVKFSLKGQNSQYVSSLAVRKMFSNKFLICSSWKVKFVSIFSKITPDNLMAKIAYKVQKRKLYK